jgi:hypothetical protein
MRLQQGMRSIGETWLGRLFQAMNTDTEISKLSDIFANVSFVCFNYDRCIEVGIFNSIRFLTNLPVEIVAQAMSHLKVWHPYGTVGSVNYNDFSAHSISFGFPSTDPNYLEILEGSKGIRTFTEGMHNQDELSEIRKELSAAQQVVYLGFSYLDQNMKLLEAHTEDGSSTIHATCYKLSGPDSDIAHWALASASCAHDQAPIFRREKVSMVSLMASDFMGQYANSLRR